MVRHFSVSHVIKFGNKQWNYYFPFALVNFRRRNNHERVQWIESMKIIAMQTFLIDSLTPKHLGLWQKLLFIFSTKKQSILGWMKRWRFADNDNNKSSMDGICRRADWKIKAKWIDIVSSLRCSLRVHSNGIITMTNGLHHTHNKHSVGRKKKSTKRTSAIASAFAT